jgi:hypothetical protein
MRTLSVKALRKVEPLRAVVVLIALTFASVAFAIPKGGVTPHEPNKTPHCTVKRTDCHHVCRPVTVYGGGVKCHRVCLHRTLKCS